MCEGTDVGAGADDRGLADGLDDGGTLADNGVPQQATGPDRRAGPDRGAALQLGAWPDAGSGREIDADVDPGARRVGDPHACAHHRLEQPGIQHLAGVSELREVVDALNLFRIITRNGGHGVAVAAQDGHRVGEIFLTLRVVGPDSLHRVGEQVTVEGVHARVDLVDRALPGRRVGVLDDSGERAVLVPDDPAVTGRVGYPRG